MFQNLLANVRERKLRKRIVKELDIYFEQKFYIREKILIINPEIITLKKKMFQNLLANVRERKLRKSIVKELDIYFDYILI